MLDHLTGLTWQQVINSGNIDLARAKAYCSTLNLQGGGWRVPARKEYYMLVDLREPNGRELDGVAFLNSPSNSFWTSSPCAGAGDEAWTVSSGTRCYPVGAGKPVRCVR